MIVSAAVKHGNAIVSLQPPNRHHHIIRWIAQVATDGAPINGEQGFLDHEGNFLNRIDSAEHAISCGQITETKFGSKLFSEDLW